MKAEGNTTREKKIYKVTIVGSIVNLLLLIFKFAAGILGRSAAMIADAVHSLSDFATDIVVLLFVRSSSKPEDEGHNYGHGKYETLATAIIGIVLFAVGIGIFWNGAKSIWSVFQGNQLEQPGMIALVAALVSIVSKEILYRYTVHVGREVSSKAVEANAWHHRSDAFSSIGTALGIGGAILLGEKWRVLDPIAAVVVSFFIMKVAYELTLPAIQELMDSSLPKETNEKIRATILMFPEVSEPHNLRTRHIGNTSAVEVHVRMDGELTLSEAHEITSKIEEKIREVIGENTIVTIHAEPRKG